MATDVNKYTTTREHLFKVLVIGEFGVGKTSIIRRYVEGYFSPNYKLTIGVDFALKTIVWDDETKVNLQLWDIAGHERFGHMTRVYYKYAIAAIIVFDLSRSGSELLASYTMSREQRIIHEHRRSCIIRLQVTPQCLLTIYKLLHDFRPATFDSITKWLNDVNSKVMLANEDPVPVMLLANKCDVENADANAHKLADFCKSHNLIGWFATSAKDDLNIEEAMKFMIGHILKLPTENQQPQDHITLPQSPVATSGTMYDESFETEAPPGKGNKGCCG